MTSLSLAEFVHYRTLIELDPHSSFRTSSDFTLFL